MKVFITGAGGFLGAHFADRLHRRGHRVAGSEFSEERVAALPGWFAGRWRIALGGEVPAGALAGQEAVIHCAYAPGRDREALNVAGTKAIAGVAAAAGVKRQCFLTSYSARPGAAGGYGRMKYALEQYFLAAGEAVLRPGLVVGPGGLCRRMARLIDRWPVLPLPDGGRHPVPLIGVEDLGRCLEAVLAAGEGGAWNLAYRREPALRELLRAIRDVSGRRCLFVPFPAGLILTPLALLRRCGLDAGVDPDSLRGYRGNRPGMHASDLDRFEVPDRPLAEVVGAAFGEGLEGAG